jgi:polysaccharide export outer membrane protein
MMTNACLIAAFVVLGGGAHGVGPAARLSRSIRMPIVAPGLQAEPPSPASVPASIPAGHLPADGRDYIVGPQDVLTITVYEEPQLTGRYTVNTDGTFAFPMIGRVTASGMSPREIEESLIKVLASGYLKKPQLTVEVEQYRSQFITVSGEVRTPGKYPLTGRMTVLEALIQAGSITPSASSEVQVLRPKADATESPDEGGASAEVIKVNVTDLQSGKLSNNVALRDGDTVFVPKAEPIFVTGQVRNPGAYPLPQEMTVLQVLSLAGGLTDRGSDRRIKLIRVIDGKKKEMSVELTDIVQPGDTLVIPQRFF